MNETSSQAGAGNPNRTQHREAVNREKQPARVLQHFEFAVLMSVLLLREEAYPAAIARRLTDQLGRHVSLAQVYVALERMHDKGLVDSRLSDPEPVRGGRSKRVFALKALGQQALRLTSAVLDRVPSAKQMEGFLGSQKEAGSAT